MRVTRRNFIATGALVGAAMAGGRAEAGALSNVRRAASAGTEPLRPARNGAFRPVVTLNGWTLPGRRNGAWTEFHLVAEPVAREMAPGLVAHLWGYNGQSPGPTIECVEGDFVRILVTNALPEPTTIHWQGLPLANGMAGVAGLTQPPIAPGETYAYTFHMTRSGTFLYRPHADAEGQAAMGLMGAIVVHPREPTLRPADRDYAILLNGYALTSTRTRPEIASPVWTINSRTFPGIDPIVARRGERVRVRVANLAEVGLSLQLQGHAFTVTATGGGWIPESAQWPDTVLDLPAGALRIIEFRAESEGDWPLHSPTPRAWPTGEVPAGRETAAHPPTAARSAGLGIAGPGPIAMGPMFTLVKVRADLAAGEYRDPGPYAHPIGTLAALAGGLEAAPTRRAQAVLGRHLEVKVARPRSRP